MRDTTRQDGKRGLPGWAAAALPAAAFFVAACPGTPEDDSGTPPAAWQVVAEDLPAGLMSVQGRSADDVWIVGAAGTAWHYDGSAFSAIATGVTDDLWWVQPTAPGAVFVGAGGRILEHGEMSGETATIPGPDAALTFFGVWGPDDGDLWAVGGDIYGQLDPAMWRNTGGTWAPAAVVPDALHAPDLYYKVHGTAADDLWVVGNGGILQRWDGAGWTDYDCGGDGVLFTVFAGGEVPVAVGGAGQALICTYDAASDTWVDTSPAFTPTVNGVGARGTTMVGVGQQGTVIRWDGSAWIPDAVRPTELVLHSVWIDEEGGIWTVGGNLNSTPITRGILLYAGPRTLPPF